MEIHNMANNQAAKIAAAVKRLRENSDTIAAQAAMDVLHSVFTRAMASEPGAISLQAGEKHIRNLELITQAFQGQMAYHGTHLAILDRLDAANKNWDHVNHRPGTPGSDEPKP